MHELKIWPEYFRDVKKGNKTFEVRKADRDYQEGDYLILHEWDPSTQDYTDSKPIRRRVTYVLNGGDFGVEKGFCIMGLEKWKGEVSNCDPEEDMSSKNTVICPDCDEEMQLIRPGDWECHNDDCPSHMATTSEN